MENCTFDLLFYFCHVITTAVEVRLVELGHDPEIADTVKSILFGQVRWEPMKSCDSAVGAEGFYSEKFRWTSRVTRMSACLQACRPWFFLTEAMNGFRHQLGISCSTVPSDLLWPHLVFFFSFLSSSTSSHTPHTHGCITQAQCVSEATVACDTKGHRHCNASALSKVSNCVSLVALSTSRSIIYGKQIPGNWS